MPSDRPLIVVIEDNATDVFLIRETVKAHKVDAELQILDDGEAAMGLISRLDADESLRCPTLVLLDINLPRTDGLRVLEHLRHSRRCANVHVIVMTSSAARADRDKATELHADYYFLKPSGYDAFLELGDIMQNGLRGSRAQ